MRSFILAALLLSLAVSVRAASPGSPEETPRRQEIDLDRLEIEGRVPSPSTLFIRERTGGLLYELFPLRRGLPEDWLPPVDKAGFEKETLRLVDLNLR
ncbi:MAG: hypothetical protein ABIH26_11040 [Candidatus Eisenbacteria bacterium]